MAYVYKHIRKDNNQPFYIGVGGLLSFDNYQRANANNWKGLKSRSNFWFNVVNKYGFNVEIVLDSCTNEAAFLKEIELIKFYGREDINTGILVNLTDGGEGCNNLSKQGREKMAFWKGKKRTKKLLKEKSTKRIPWNKGLKWSEEMKIKLKECAKTKIYSKESKKTQAEKISIALKNKPKTIEHIHNMGVSLIDIETNIIYPTIKEASLAININYGTLKSYLCGKSKNKTKLRYLNEQKT